jgi:hypothetical protein
MKGLLITILGLALIAVGLFNMQNNFYGCTCGFLGGFLIGIGINETIKTKK